MSEEMIDATFKALSRERSLYGVHIAGGEATLNWDRLLYALDSSRRHGIELDYLETNASWCKDEETTHEGFQELKAAGLDAVLISASLFHNEFTPLSYTLRAIDAAIATFGQGGVIVWTMETLRAMQRHLDPDRRYPLKESAKLLGLDIEQGDLYRLHTYLRPGGRAAVRLADGLPRRPMESFANITCGSTLEGTQHFHIDPRGNLFTGHCPGISVATIDDLHPEVTKEDVPVLWHLRQHGPGGAWQRLAPELEPDPAGYVHECHVCLDLCNHLYKTGKYAELRPAEYYLG